jgi:hypothetical protein
MESLMLFTIWKVRHKAGDEPDYFSYGLKREGFFPLTFTANQFNMLLPTVKTDLIPEAPETGTIEITGDLK